ncbi:MAG TPA: septum formation initiator family protein [Bryobacteraceae bacterium]|nr:septum formation initiator family protein [Bryobacteraceae bacterium]
MKLPFKTILSAGALLVAGGYLLYSFLGPSGVPMVLEKRREIRDLQQQNADIEREIQARSERIRTFAESPSEQDRRFREDLKLLKKGETTFVTP